MRLITSLNSFKFENLLKGLTKGLDVDRVADEATAIILNRIRTRFLAERGPVAKWVPSKAGQLRKSGGYTRRNGRKYSGTGTLFETGTLFHSIQAVRTFPGGRAIQTDVPYAKYHQGPEAKQQRVFMAFNRDDADMVEKILMRRIQDLLK